MEALSHADAENRIIEEMKPYVSGVSSVEGVKKQKISDLFGIDDPDGDRWYKAKVVFISLDEIKTTEKRTTVMIYAKADDIESALKKVRNGMTGTMSDYEIVSISETPILDVYSYKEDDEIKN